MTNDDFKAALNGTLLSHRELYDALVPALKARQCFENGDCEPTPGANARMLLMQAIEVLRALVGPDALAQAYGDDPSADAPREEHLMALWWRLAQIDDIYRRSLPSRKSPSSVGALADEIMAIAKGDKPTLLAERPSVQGRPLNAWRLAQRQLAALEWEAHLRAKGGTAASAQNAVATAFGQTWDTIRSWKVPIVRELGQAVFDRAMRAARDGRGFYSHAGMPGESDAALIREDAGAYSTERRRHLSVVGKE